MKYGWRPDRENFSELNAIRADPIMLRTYGMDDLYTVADPEQFIVTNPEGLLQTEDQQRTNSCVGHGGSSAVERCLFLASGRNDQLSRWYAYIQSQRFAGIRGDNGSTITAMVRVARELGVCREDLLPFPGSYVTSIPDGCNEDAARFKIQTAMKLESITDDQLFLGKNIGAMIIGVNWTASFDEHPTLIERFVSGRGGGHCVCIPFLSPRVDQNGDHYAWLLNSWGLRWGKNGWKEISPQARTQLYRHQWTEMWGVSDMLDPSPRAVIPLAA